MLTDLHLATLQNWLFAFVCFVIIPQFEELTEV